MAKKLASFKHFSADVTNFIEELQAEIHLLQVAKKRKVQEEREEKQAAKDARVANTAKKSRTARARSCGAEELQKGECHEEAKPKPVISQGGMGK